LKYFNWFSGQISKSNQFAIGTSLKYSFSLLRPPKYLPSTKICGMDVCPFVTFAISFVFFLENVIMLSLKSIPLDRRSDFASLHGAQKKAV
tara:strand:+ start:458 stop:730 length:273 start_codon:yes stop_codon:yes gene_type:complete